MVNYANLLDKNNSTSTGSYILYEGKPAHIKWSTPWSDTITIEVEGKTITVNKNDLFGINDKKNEYAQWLETQAESRREEIIKNEKEMTFLKELYANSTKMITTCKETMYCLLRKNQVSSYNELKGDAQEKYLAELATLKDSTSIKWHAGNGINRVAHRSINEALNLGEIQNQQVLLEAMTK